jgi:hypothetical protein
MSHHLDTPLAAQSGQLYIDDLYVFQGERGTVFVLDVNSNVNGMFTEPGFHPEARYEVKVHVDGAAFETLTYRVSFGEPGGDARQALRLHVLTGDDARRDDADGELVATGRTGETVTAGGARLWAGRIGDPFYIDLSLLAIVNDAIAKGTAVDLSGWRPEAARNSFAGTHVDTIVLEVPHEDPRLRPGTRIGVWGATKLATDAGGWRPVNRAGHPMMWPIFWPTDTDFTNPANTRHPSEDAAADGRYLADAVAAVVAASGTSADPHGYGATVAGLLFPDVLPYVVGTPATYGFAGFNGRTTADDAPAAMLSLVAATAVPSGLTPATSAGERSDSFPYVRPL